MWRYHTIGLGQLNKVKFKEIPTKVIHIESKYPMMEAVWAIWRKAEKKNEREIWANPHPTKKKMSKNQFVSMKKES